MPTTISSPSHTQSKSLSLYSSSPITKYSPTTTTPYTPQHIYLSSHATWHKAIDHLWGIWQAIMNTLVTNVLVKSWQIFITLLYDAKLAASFMTRIRMMFSSLWCCCRLVTVALSLQMIRGIFMGMGRWCSRDGWWLCFSRETQSRWSGAKWRRIGLLITFVEYY